MSSVLKYLFRNIWEKKTRSFIIVFAVALTALLLLMNLEIRQYFGRSYEEYVKSATGGADLVITADAKGGNPLFRADEVNLAGLPVAHAMEVFAASGKLEDGEGLLKLQVLGLHPEQAADMGVLAVQEEGSGAAFADGAAIISRKAAKRLGAGIGSQVAFTVNGEERVARVEAIAGDTGLFARDTEDAITLALPLETANGYFGMAGLVNTLYMDVAEGQDIAGAAGLLQENNAAMTVKAVLDQGEMETQMNAVFLALLFVMLVLALISFYMISSLFQVIISERMPVIGTFRSIGATKGQMNGLLLLESLLYGAAGGVLGLGCGYFALPPVFGLLNQYDSGVTAAAVEYHPLYFAAAFVCALFVAGAGSLSHILKTGRYSTKDIILNTVQQPVKLGKRSAVIGGVALAGAAITGFLNTRYHMLPGLLAIVLLLTGGILLARYAAAGLAGLIAAFSGRLVPGTARLGLHNVRGNRFLQGSITLTTVALTLMIVIYTVVLGVQNYMTDISAANDFDISITAMDRETERYDRLGEMPGVAEMYKDYILFGSMEGEGQSIGGVAFIGMDRDFGFQRFHQDGIVFDREEAARLKDGRNMLIDRFLGDKYGLGVGDTVELHVEDADIRPVYTIIGLMDSSNFVTTRKGAVIGMDAMLADFNNSPYQLLFKTEGDREAVKQSLARELADTLAQVRTLDEIIQASTQGVDGLFLALNLFIVLGMLLAGFGIVNNLLVGFFQRRRELAVLYSVCMSREQVRRMLVAEMLCVYASSCLLAGVLSYGASLLLPGFLWGAGIAFRFPYPLGFALGIAAAGLAVFAVITLVPLVRFSRMNVVGQLKMD